MRVALLTYNARSGDAIGQAVADKLAFFLEHHAEVRVYLEDDRHLHPAVRPYAERVTGPDALQVLLQELRNADLVLAEYGQYYPMLAVLPALAGDKPRVVIDYHGVTPPELWGPGQREALEQGVRYRAVLWAADAVLVHSQFTRHELSDQLGYPDARLYPIGFPIDRDHFAPALPEKDWRRALHLEDAKVLLFVGRVAPNKRLPLLIEALSQWREQRPAVHLLVAGNDGELYQSEAEACRRLVQERGVGERVHFLGQQYGTDLRDLYRCADVLVHPSLWETFCVPIIEAMACGLPVAAARATALPETVGDAGLTFTPEDVDDLVRQVERVLYPPTPRPRTGKVAVVAFRFGTDFVGGAETSLRTMARSLQASGRAVEVFTTCVRSESEWRDELPEGPCVIDGLPVRRFRMDAHDRPRHLETVRRILDARGAVSVAAAQEYLRHSIQSTALIEELKQRADEFDAVFVGPYLFGLTAAVATALGEKTLLVPCFHDEPLARLPIWSDVYGKVGGLLWHSAEEQRFAEVELGFNHPRSRLLGTLLYCHQTVSSRQAEMAGRYLVYCGRYSAEKELPRLLDYCQRYDQHHPGRFKLVCLGQGPIKVPLAPWSIDLGYVDEQRKRDVVAGAAALIQLSRFESLSLVALEAWSLGTPVIADPDCAVLAGHLHCCEGGRAVGDFEAFAAVLDDLWESPDEWRLRGERGQAYVRAQYGSAEKFSGRLQASLEDLRRPLGACMRERGLVRANGFRRAIWRERFAGIMETVVESEPLVRRVAVEVQPRGEGQHFAAGGGSVLLPVKIVNHGTQVLWPTGPAGWMLRALVMEAPEVITETSLPGPLAPGQTLAAMVALSVPATPGEYQGKLWAEGAGHASTPAVVRLTVGAERGAPCDGLLTDVHAALAAAHQVQQLPDDYHDVTQGALAGLKKRIKSKLLGNFKHAYVDVLSRQQSSYNEHLIRAVAELTECCATLDHAVRLLHDKVQRLEAALELEHGKSETLGELEPSGPRCSASSGD